MLPICACAFLPVQRTSQYTDVVLTRNNTINITGTDLSKSAWLFVSYRDGNALKDGIKEKIRIEFPKRVGDEENDDSPSLSLSPHPSVVWEHDDYTASSPTQRIILWPHTCTYTCACTRRPTHTHTQNSPVVTCAPSTVDLSLCQ